MQAFFTLFCIKRKEKIVNAKARASYSAQKASTQKCRPTSV